MATISKDTPCLFITTVAHHRLPVFRTESLKRLACRSLDEARHSGGFALFAYVIMPEHLHVLTDSTLPASGTLRYINGILSRRVIGYLKERGLTTSLEKLRCAPREREHQYSLVDHHSNALPVFSEAFFMQKVNYIHLNPVRAGVVARAEDYRWSSGGAGPGERLKTSLCAWTLRRFSGGSRGSLPRRQGAALPQTRQGGLAPGKAKPFRKSCGRAAQLIQNVETPGKARGFPQSGAAVRLLPVFGATPAQQRLDRLGGTRLLVLPVSGASGVTSR